VKMKSFGSAKQLSIRYSGVRKTSRVVVGSRLIQSLSSLVEPLPDRAFLIADDVVARLYADGITDVLEGSGVEVRVLTFRAGEGSKTRRVAARLQDALISRGVERGSCVLALGGGVCCDLAGFVAASVLRGLRLVYIPTTLVAMIDAAIGGKVAVDHPRGKNLIGFFYPAELVLVDMQFLKALPTDEWKNGLSELVKIAVAADADLFESIALDAKSLRKPFANKCGRLITRAIELKAAIVGKDPYELGVRAALNFGHTIGHALERELDYTGRHGEAVSIGMALESELAARLGILERDGVRRIEALLKNLGLPHALPDGIDVRRIQSHVGFDKKRRGGVVYFSLPSAIGRMARRKGVWGVPVASDVLLKFLEEKKCSA